MITYLVNTDEYSLSYQELKNSYHNYRSLTNEDFIRRIKEILHFACIVIWMKERSEYALRDDGVIHQLIHLLGKVNCDMSEEELLKIVRDRFNSDCELV